MRILKRSSKNRSEIVLARDSIQDLLYRKGNNPYKLFAPTVPLVKRGRPLVDGEIDSD